MAELKVGRELECLGHGDVAERLEHHHRDRLAGEGVADDQLGNNTVVHTCQYPPPDPNDALALTSSRPAGW